MRVRCVRLLQLSYSELGGVEEAEDPGHGELGHGEEEGAEDRNRHHEVEVDLRPTTRGLNVWDSVEFCESGL